MTDTINTLLDKMKNELQDQDDASMQDMFDAFGTRSYGSFLFILSLLVLSPISAIPGISIMAALIIMLVAGQFFFRDNQPWLPKPFLEKTMSADDAVQTLDKVRHYMGWLDKIVKPRFEWLVSTPMLYIAMVAVIGLAAMMFPLALVPWGVMAPGAACLLLSLAIIARDGVAMALGLIASAFAAYEAYSWS